MGLEGNSPPWNERHLYYIFSKINSSGVSVFLNVLRVTILNKKYDDFLVKANVDVLYMLIFLL